MAAQETPIDERTWRSEQALANLAHPVWGGGGLNRNKVHMYFLESIFMDRQSRNWQVAMQSPFEVNSNKEEFEKRVRSRPGIEYMIVAEPEPLPEGGDTGTYVFRKQERITREGFEDELKVLGTYFLMGETIFQAPSVEDIITSNILALTTSLSKFFSLASSLPIYTSGRGYTYLPTTTTTTRTSATDSSLSRRSSRAGSPIPENSSQTLSSSGNDTNASAMSTSIAALRDSFRSFAKYGSEYIDENPLTGEPGSFKLATTARAVHEQKVKAAEEEKRRKEALAAAAERAVASQAPTPVSGVMGTGVEKVGKKGKERSPSMAAGTIPKKKREKSKGLSRPGSPLSPTGPPV
ncbi:MED6-domain-containing protein [Saccharata proteae CBS 121410]|uniref:Mediator of RNA polymerase II transcription subunit 6 n=1 Tax=Saccharata proteae CBS 121410 TaxID=1314787 RepID=A0A9P4LWC4_9PEZI|nr:MED6-domain-containing protein [Saccharata proteae CBS 121410]